MLGGSISFSSTNFNSENYGAPHQYGDLKINPNVGYFLIDRLSVGIKTSIEKSNIKEPGTSGQNRYTDFNLGPFLRYYLLNPDKNVNIFSEGLYQYGFEKGERETISKNTFSISAGPVIYFNTVVGLELVVSYSTYKYPGRIGSNNTITIGIGLQVHLEKEE